MTEPTVEVSVTSAVEEVEPEVVVVETAVPTPPAEVVVVEPSADNVDAGAIVEAQNARIAHLESLVILTQPEPEPVEVVVEPQQPDTPPEQKHWTHRSARELFGGK